MNWRAAPCQRDAARRAHRARCAGRAGRRRASRPCPRCRPRRGRPAPPARPGGASPPRPSATGRCCRDRRSRRGPRRASPRRRSVELSVGRAARAVGRGVASGFGGAPAVSAAARPPPRRSRRRRWPRAPLRSASASASNSGSTTLSSSSASTASTSDGGPRCRRFAGAAACRRASVLVVAPAGRDLGLLDGRFSLGDRISKSSTWNEPRALTMIRFCSRFSISSRNGRSVVASTWATSGWTSTMTVSPSTRSPCRRSSRRSRSDRAARLGVALALAGRARLGQRCAAATRASACASSRPGRARRCA